MTDPNESVSDEAVSDEPVSEESVSDEPVSDEPVSDEASVDVWQLPGGPRAALEAVLMVVEEPVSEQDLAGVLELPDGQVRRLLLDLAEEYDRDRRGFALRFVGGGWRFYSRHDYAPLVERFVPVSSTHLDVYKRQVWTSPRSPSPRSPTSSSPTCGPSRARAATGISPRPPSFCWSPPRCSISRPRDSCRDWMARTKTWS